MVSASKEKRLAAKAAAGKGKTSKAAQLDAHGNPIVSDEPATSADKLGEVKRLTDQMDKHGLSDRVTTGVLSSIASSRDVKITSTSLVFHGRVLITDSTLELNFSRRYGLLGENGCGKSTLLKAIAAREYPVPEHVDIYLLNEGAPPSELGALEWVVTEAQNEMQRLENKAEEILEKDGPDSQVLMDIYDVCSLPPPLSSFPKLDLSLVPLLTCLPPPTAHGQDGPLDLLHSRLPYPDGSGLQQDHHPQEDKGHVRWMEDACCSRQGPVRQAYPPASRRPHCPFGLGGLRVA